jgi:hypothetical protein
VSRTNLKLIVAAVAVTLFAIVGATPAHASPCARPTDVRLTDASLAMPAILKGPAIDLQITNTGKIAHELAVNQIQPGTTLEQVINAAATDDRTAPFIISDPGGINLLGPGERLRYERVLPAGTYAFFNANADPAVRFTPAAFAIVTIVDEHRTTRPARSREISLGDDAITLPKISAGTRTYAINNRGTNPHELFIVGVKNPANLDRSDELGAWLEGGQVGPPPFPVHFPGGHQTIDPGVSVRLTMNLRHGTTYAFVDFSTGATTTALA